LRSFISCVKKPLAPDFAELISWAVDRAPYHGSSASARGRRRPKKRRRELGKTHSAGRCGRSGRHDEFCCGSRQWMVPTSAAPERRRISWPARNAACEIVIRTSKTTLLQSCDEGSSEGSPESPARSTPRVSAASRSFNAPRAPHKSSAQQSRPGSAARISRVPGALQQRSHQGRPPGYVVVPVGKR